MSTKLKTLPAKFEPGFSRQLDQRTALATQLTASFEEIVDDLGGSGQLTHVKLALVERFCFMEAHIQALEARIATEPKRSDELMGRWVQMCNSLTGLGKMIGVERKKTKVVDLQQYVREAKKR